MVKKDILTPRTLKGFRDSLPADASRRKAIIDQIWHGSISAGFRPIDTPALEYLETLVGTGNQETDKEIYRFTDHGDREVGLRFDLTVPFARFVAQNQANLQLPFKKFQFGNVWRGEKPQKGRYREFCQADIDIIGVDSMLADVEVLSTVRNNLRRVMQRPFTICIGNRVVLSALIRKAFDGIDSAGEGKALVALDKLAKIGRQPVIDLLSEIPAANPEASAKLLDALTTKDAQGHTDLGALAAFLADDACEELDRLQKTLVCLKDLEDNGPGAFQLDLTIARGLGYYTGIVYETFLDELPGFGSVSSGGRYNDLVSRFSKQSLPGIGGSVGVDRLLAALQELDGGDPSPRQGLFIAIAGDKAIALALSICQELRAKLATTVDLSMKSGKLGPQFKFADRASYAAVLTIGDDEMARRRQNWAAPAYKVKRGTLYKYIKSVKSASEGCVTDE